MLKYVLSLLASGTVNRLSDEEIVEQYLATGNNYFFEIIYHRYASKIFGKCITLMKDETMAEDLTQDILMKIMLSLSSFGGRSKLSTWIYSITYNFCIDKIRKLKKCKETEFEDGFEVYDDHDEIEDKRLLEIKLTELKEIMDTLNEGDKSILMMKYMDNMSIAEISEVVDKTESAVKMQLKRAKHKVARSYVNAH